MVRLPEETGVYGYLQKPSLVDFPSHISGVFFTAGCNFSCGYCHNAPLMGTRSSGLSAQEFAQAVEKMKRSDWISGVTISGGEPTLLEHLPQIVRWLRQQGLAVKLDTNGSNPRMLEELLDELDYVAMDIKCAPESYGEFVGYQRSDRIIESVRLLSTWKGTSELRTTVVASFHDTEQMLSIGNLIEGCELYTLQPFVPRDNLPDVQLRSEPRTPAGLLDEYARLLEPYAKRVEIKGRG